MAERRREDASRNRPVKQAPGSDHELSSDFVEGPEWKGNNGRNCALSLFVKYRMVQGKKIFKEAKSIPCARNFLAYWNFYTKHKQGQKMFNDIVKKYGCSVTVSADDEDLFIFEVTCTNLKWELDVFNFVNDVLDNIYKCAKQSLCCDPFSVDHRIQEDTLQRVKERKELYPAWIEVVGEHDPDAVYVVCAVKDKVSVLIELTEIVSKAMKCYKNHEVTVAVDFMWQRVLKIFGYLQEFNDKYSNLIIEPDESKDAVVLKGPRDESKAAADHFLELLGTARNEIHEILFSPVFKFEILTYPEMCDYIGNFIPKVPILWIPNYLTKKIHIFSKHPEQAKGTEKVIKGCIQEKLYTSSKYHSLFPAGVRSLEKLKQKHKGKIVVQTLDPGLLVTTADDIFTTVDAEIQAIISNEIESSGQIAETVHPTNYGKETFHLESATRNDIPESLKPNKLNQSKGASGGQNLSLQLGKSDCAQDPSPHSSNSEDESANDDKLLFRTPSAKTKVFVYEASIVSLPGVSAIVNAANDRLWHGDGVAYHISMAAGGEMSKLEKECRDYIESNGKIAVTRNFTSSAGNMPYEGVIHAVGPMWSDYDVKEECAKDLCLTIFNVLVEADKRKFSKIALPVISSGIFGVPKRMCAEMYIKGVMDYDSKGTPTQVKEIHFVDINKDILQEIEDAYGRWKQNHKSQDKKAQGTTSESSGQIAETVYPTSVPSGNPAASQHRSKSSKMSTFQLSKTTCVKVYVCSIVEVKDVDAIACEVDTDFSIKRHAVAQAIKKAGGTSYEEEFNKMVKAKSGSGEDVFICKTGGSLKSNKIGHVIHIKCEKFENNEDMDKLKHLYVQVFQHAKKEKMQTIVMPFIGAVFQHAKKEKMQTIVMPLIGAASLKEATKDFSAECSRLFAKTLKEVVESRGKEMNVKEIHLVDQNEKLINFIRSAFQELNTANTDNMQAKVETKRDPSSKSKSDDPKEDSPKPKPGLGKGWLKVENGSHKCSFPACKRRGTKMCEHCNGFLCDICIHEELLSKCPFCQK